MPIYKTKNENFFKKWTPEMAYVLGFFTADGNMLRNKRGAHFVEIQSTDKEIVSKIRKVLKSNLKIGEYQPKNPKHKKRYRLQIGSKEIFNDLIRLGITPRKSKIIKLPNVPIKYLPHFVRGYFDGDGCVAFGFYRRTGRINKSPVLLTRFTSGSKIFLGKLKNRLEKEVGISGCLCRKKNDWDLGYSSIASKKLCNFMYSTKNNNKKLIFLERKFNIYRVAGVI